MKGRMRIRAWALAALALPLGVGCFGTSTTVDTKFSPKAGAAAGPNGKPKLLFITNTNSDWWNAVDKGMVDGAAAFGCEVEMRRNEGTAQGQVDRLKEAMTLGDIQGVAVSVLEADSPGILDAMRELRKAGKAVLAIDSDVAADAADARDAYIGTDNFKAGEVAGRTAATLRNAGGKVCDFVGTAAAANARARQQGFLKGAGPAFGTAPAETFEDGGDASKAGTNVVTALSKYPDVGLLLGIYSYNGPAIAEQMARNPEVRKKLTVVTFDLDEAAVGHLEQGRVDATVCQNPYEMGYQGVKLLKALIAKDQAAIKEILPDGKSRDTGVRIVVPRGDSPVVGNKAKGDDVITIEEMKSWLSSKGLKSS